MSNLLLAAMLINIGPKCQFNLFIDLQMLILFYFIQIFVQGIENKKLEQNTG